MDAIEEFPFADADVATKFASYPAAVRARLLEVRRMIFGVAAHTRDVGPVEEALRWGQPSYLTTASGSGSTVRIDERGGDGFAVYFICHTNLVDTFRSLYPGTFRFDRNRALIFSSGDAIPEQELAHCLSLALTYHARNKSRRGRPRKKIP
jgi:hypothetical protein